MFQRLQRCVKVRDRLCHATLFHGFTTNHGERDPMTADAETGEIRLEGVEMTESAKLTTKQERFVAAYDGNATAAAKIAGYKNPRQAGAENMSKLAICEIIQKA